MNFEIDGAGLSGEHIEAMTAGLAAMSAEDTPVVITDDFVAQVRQRTGQLDYSAGRGAGVVAAKTLTGGGAPIIVVNAPAVADRPAAMVERLLAHEGGHVLLERRGEVITGRQGLVDSTSQWQMIGVGSLAIDELRVEKALAALRYPVSGAGAVSYLDDAMYWLNCELVEAVCDPRSADPLRLLQSVISAQDWLTKNLAYLAAYHVGVGDPDLSQLSEFTRANWADYLGEDWPARAQLYASVPDALQAMAQEPFDELLLQAMRLETALLRAFRFYFTESDRGTAFYRDTGDEARWDLRVRRAMAETAQRQSA